MKQINDRFSFDKIFRSLLEEGYSHEEAKEEIMIVYSLSTLVFQERIENESYFNISTNKEMEDLKELKNEAYNKILACNHSLN